MGLQISLRNRFLRFTPEGVKFILISLAIGFAAVNTGNNLLYLVLGMLLSLIIASGFLSELMVKGLEVKRSLPPYIFARTPCSALLTIKNRKRYLTSFSLELEEDVNGEKTGGLAYLFRVRPQETATQVYRLSFSRRGFHNLRKPHLLTRFPFGFFIKGIRVKNPLQVLVYPQLLPWNDAIPEAYRRGEGPWSTPHKGRGENIFGIREYLPGDTSRDIHWRSTAKLSQTMVKEYESAGMKKVHIVLDTSLPEEVTPMYREQFEGCVSKAASLAYHLLKRHDFLVGLSLGDEFIPFDKGEVHLHHILRSLALVGPVPGRIQQGVSPQTGAFTVEVTARG